MSAEIYHLVNAPVTAYAFNGNNTQLALCANNNDVLIFQRPSPTSQDWKQTHTLVGHDKTVTSMDWAPQTNRLVTCAQDRNAYVWVFDAGSNQWKPTLVLLRINRAATFVRWSPNEQKFAVASGARLISVCYFEQENDWWVSKHLKKPIRSTVLSLDWHPNNVLLACGSSDMKCRVFSAYIKGLDEKPAASAWGERLPFGTLCAEYGNGRGGWIHGVAFSPTGDELAWVGHDSAIYFADPAKNSVQEVKLNILPFMSLVWVGFNSVVAAGHECAPYVYTRSGPGAQWGQGEKLDVGGAGAKKAVGGNAALNKFKQMDSRAQDSGQGVTSSDLQTVHQNSINGIRIYEIQGNGASKFSTSGVDGRVVVWDLKSLESQIAGLKIN
ncbi:hypothetical protein MIR68_005386 [Amoeboaphelidium protococcarum]|nr:hypothetical protein MIR68_005386 [Amoeboaphelidium protococcarum]